MIALDELIDCAVVDLRVAEQLSNLELFLIANLLLFACMECGYLFLSFLLLLLGYFSLFDSTIRQFFLKIFNGFFIEFTFLFQ